MKKVHLIIPMVLLCFGIFYQSSFAQVVAKIISGDGKAADRFGNAVAISGDYILVGAHQADVSGNNSGAAYIFKRSGKVWLQTQKLVPGDGAAGEEFGYSVALNDNFAVVGAWKDNDLGTNSGSVYVFQRSPNGWQQMAKLRASDGQAFNLFGGSLALSNETIAVGAYRDNDRGANSGSAYVFRFNGSSWTQEAKLIAPDGVADDEFGKSIAINGNHLAVGAHKDDDRGSNSGTVYIFEKGETNWAFVTKALASDGAVDDYFGHAVSINGDYLVVGARGDDDKGNESGSVYIYKRSETGWSEIKKLNATDGSANDLFGWSISFSGTYLVVGAYGDAIVGPKTGSLYIYQHNGADWHEIKFTAPDAAAYDWFGYAVAVSNGIAVVGACVDDDRGSGSGSAYVKYIDSPPRLASVTDVPFDQGGKVTVTWEASPLDNGVDTLAYYSIWRALPSQSQSGTAGFAMEYMTRNFTGQAIRTTQENGTEMAWEWLANQPAHFYANYAFTATTLYDSISTTDAMHYFLVSAHTPDPNIYFDSNVLGGYSVDNLAPEPPTGLIAYVVGNAIELAWDESPAQDLKYYFIYRNGVISDTTIYNSYLDNTVEIGSSYYYVITAVDVHENESKFSDQATTGPVPVELSAFSATVGLTSVNLEWSTASETNNYGFEIERQAKGTLPWQVIGFVPGHGTTAETKHYAFTDPLDEMLISERNELQYRLKQLDVDGTFSFSNTLSVITGIPDQFELRQNYPNPFNAETVVQLNLSAPTEVELVIYNTMGQRIRTLAQGQFEAGSYKLNWNGTDEMGIQVVSGVYLYQVKAGNFITARRMILVK